MANMRKRLQEELNLTEDQQKQFRQIMETQRQAVENWQKEHGEALNFLFRLYIHEGDTDQAEVASKYLDFIYPPRVTVAEM